VMRRVAFSPSFIWTTPSSQPTSKVSLWSDIVQFEKHTLDNLTNTNGNIEVTTADGAIEP